MNWTRIVGLATVFLGIILSAYWVWYYYKIQYMFQGVPAGQAAYMPGYIGSIVVLAALLWASYFLYKGSIPGLIAEEKKPAEGTAPQENYPGEEFIVP